jgi:hypothetical protein
MADRNPGPAVANTFHVSLTTVLNSTTPMVVVMAVANSGFFASPEMVNCRNQ